MFSLNYFNLRDLHNLQNDELSNINCNEQLHSGDCKNKLKTCHKMLYAQSF